MGLIHWVRAGVEMPAKRAFLWSMGFHRTREGYWASDHSRERVHKRDLRRWTLAELRRHYMNYML